MSDEHPTPASQPVPGIPYVTITGQLVGGQFIGHMSEASLAGLQIATPPPSPPRPGQTAWTGPYGTDFIIFACGGGANVEDMPDYGTDAQLPTGNLPGIARSSFVNRTLRQGAFVAAAISTFLAQQLTPTYIADDGDLLKYVGYFREAINAMILAAIPPGPDLGAYLPLVGGTMQGVIDFQVGGPTVRLPNNTFVVGRDTGGVQHGLIGMNSANQVQVGTTGPATSHVGSAHYFNQSIFIPNSTAYQSYNAAGSASYTLLQLFSDNNLYLGAGPASNYYRCAAGGGHFFNNNIIVPNNSFLWGATTDGVNHQLMGFGTDNMIYAGDGAHSQTIRAPNLYISGTAWHGSNVVIPNNAFYYGDITNGTPYTILGVNNNNVCVVGNSGLTTNYVGSNNVFNAGLFCYGSITFGGGATVAINNNVWYYGLLTNGTWGGLISCLNDNNVHINSGFGTTYIGTSTVISGSLQLTGGPLYTPNNNPHYWRDTGGSWWNGVNLGSDNQWYFGQDGNHNLQFRGNAWFNATVTASYLTATGNIQANGNIAANGTMYCGYLQDSGGASFGANVSTSGFYYANGVGFGNVGGWFYADHSIRTDGTLQAPYIHSTGDVVADGSLYTGGCHLWNDQIGYLQSDSPFRAPYIVSWGDLTVQHANCNNGLCVSGAAFNMDYTVAFPYNYHTQWYNSLGCYAAFFAPYSDERYKQNIIEVTNERDALAAILPIKLFSYDVEHEGPREIDADDPSRHVTTGFTAQQIRESMPDAVLETQQPVEWHPHGDDTGAGGCYWDTRSALALDTMTLIAYQMRAIQQLAERVMALEAARA